MKKIVLVFAAVMITVSGFAQKTADIGIMGRNINLLGRCKEVPPFQSFNPNFGVFSGIILIKE